jgi:hypothetical protein
MLIKVFRGTKTTIVHVKKSCKQLAKMFMRFQEFYESPEFRGKIFTRKEYLQWYKRTRGTKYENDWAGFNIPGWVIDVFKHGCFDPLTKPEQELIALCPVNERFYVIGTEANNLTAMKHEIAHAMFYLNDNYMSEAVEIVKGIPKTAQCRLEHFLKTTGYHQSSFIDEMQAYVLCDPPTEQTKDAHEKLNRLYELHSPHVKIVDC